MNSFEPIYKYEDIHITYTAQYKGVTRKYIIDQQSNMPVITYQKYSVCILL